MAERPKLLQQFQGMFIDPADAARNAASFLFHEIETELGRSAARRIFAIFGTPPSARKVARIKNHGLLDMLDMMKPKPVVLRLAKMIAKENALLPRAEQRGAGSTDVHALEKHIRSLVKARDTALKNGSWWGPITPDQAVRHFGAKKVATFSKKR